ncbi:gluconokinase [Bifidobacterium sp. ESL0775]|uniref:gluconokinase n=1 Tax=Bifidobacterium sp. ESL0775 TaxID=2983230 RepID=UPI0023F97AA6|nr:gluconokinase [Bifidobacterium sp. ESL0775]WEV68802.1 gluconokinase [Bifidobacterium sp. ESL0775]
MSTHIIVMGVSGCGKTTVAQALADKFGFQMAEGDDFHPQANVDKMSHGIPLNDEDRWPWLKTINQWMRKQDAKGVSTVVSCSALKRAYRDVLRKDLDVLFIHLVGSQDLIGSRMRQRKGHYMPVSLLPSQFADLESLQPGEEGVEVSIDASPEHVIEEAAKAVNAWRASIAS